MVVLLGATSLMAVPVITLCFVGDGSHAYAAGARGGDVTVGTGARGGHGGRGGDAVALMPRR